MRQAIFFAISLFFLLTCFAQESIEKTLNRFNEGSVSYISVDTLKNKPHFTLLDAREKKEYDVSHLKDAQWVGFNSFDIKALKRKIADKNTPIVVYCSIGVRSEIIGEKLVKSGYRDVQNLYGGIFLWKNQGNTVVDTLNQTTEKVHAYDKVWGKLLTNGKKVY